VACAARDGRLHDALLADCEASNVLTELCDDTGEFVAKCDGDGVVGARMRGRGREGRAAEVFVKVGAADTYVGGRDLVCG
jgi:hypothetical protein